MKFGLNREVRTYVFLLTELVLLQTRVAILILKLLRKKVFEYGCFACMSVGRMSERASDSSVLPCGSGN